MARPLNFFIKSHARSKRMKSSNWNTWQSVRKDFLGRSISCAPGGEGCCQSWRIWGWFWSPAEKFHLVRPLGSEYLLPSGLRLFSFILTFFFTQNYRMGPAYSSRSHRLQGKADYRGVWSSVQGRQSLGLNSWGDSMFAERMGEGMIQTK